MIKALSAAVIMFFSIASFSAEVEISELDSHSLAITVISPELFNKALANLAYHQKMGFAYQVQNRDRLYNSFVEGGTGGHSIPDALEAAQQRKAVCTLNFRDDETSAVPSKETYAMAEGDVLTPEARQTTVGGPVRIEHLGAVYFENKPFYVFCQKPGLTIEYFNRAFHGVLEMKSINGR